MSSIPATGVHKLPDTDYFEIDLPSSSTTKSLLNGTNAHLAYERANPRGENDAFAIGAYTHALLLDPKSIDDGFIRIGSIDRRTKEGKELWASAQRRAESTGARIINDEQVTLAEMMAQSVYENPAAARLLNTALEREVTVIGEIAGRPAKAKIDAIYSLAGANMIIDIKTTESASPQAFAASAAKYGYYHQAAWYSRLIRQTSYGECTEFLIIAVEKTAPHLCAVYRVPQIAIEISDQKLDELARRWWAVKEGDSTGYPQTITELEPPAWWLKNSFTID